RRQEEFRPHRLLRSQYRLLRSFSSAIVLLPAGVKWVQGEASAMAVTVLTTALLVPSNKNARGKRCMSRPVRARPPSRRSMRHKSRRKRRRLQGAFRPHRQLCSLHRLFHP
ncbi:unnamed protein product, partial [Ectocarpus sp. 12 AP-2014]